MNALTAQSPDIAQGVDDKEAEGKEPRRAGRGRPGPYVWFRGQRDAEFDARPDLLRACPRRAPDQDSQGEARSRWIRPDCKTQVSLQYNGNKIERIDAVVVSTQHRDTVKHKEILRFYR